METFRLGPGKEKWPSEDTEFDEFNEPPAPPATPGKLAGFHCTVEDELGVQPALMH